MYKIRRQLFGFSIVAASSLLALQAARAVNGPAAIQIDGGPFGALELSGGMDGYGYYLTGTGDKLQEGSSVLGNGTSNGAEVGSSVIEVQKTTGQLQFTIEVGSNGGDITLGASHPSQTHINALTTGWIGR
jgi:hypothetical protein